MQDQVSVTSVPTPSIPSSLDMQSAGDWHTYYMYTGYSMTEQTGFSQDFNVWSQAIRSSVQSLISSGILVSGSDIYIEQMLEALGNALEQQSFDVGISGLEDIVIALKSNSSFVDTGIMAVASIGYSSAVFWNQVLVNTGNNGDTMLSWLHIKLPTWVITVCKDIAGALSGGEAGATVGGIIGGPVGASIGLGIGLVAGGVAGSES